MCISALGIDIYGACLEMAADFLFARILAVKLNFDCLLPLTTVTIDMSFLFTGFPIRFIPPLQSSPSQL